MESEKGRVLRSAALGLAIGLEEPARNAKAAVK